MCWLPLVGWYTVDRHIRQGKLLTRDEAVWILKQGIRVHKDYLTATWDTNATGTDEQHKTAIGWYEAIINLLQGRALAVTIAAILLFLKDDVASHQWYIDNPQYITGTIGSIAHQLKWRDRWQAIIKLIETEVRDD